MLCVGWSIPFIWKWKVKSWNKKLLLKALLVFQIDMLKSQRILRRIANICFRTFANDSKANYHLRKRYKSFMDWNH